MQSRRSSLDRRRTARIVRGGAGLALAASLIALPGCATQVPDPRPAAQAMAVPAAWTAPVPAGQQPLVAWWQHFDDAPLTRLIDAALAANTDLAGAAANLRRARALGDAAAAGLLPSATLSASAQRSLPVSAAGGSGNLFRAGFDAAWEPDIWGGAAHAAAAGAADAGAAAATLAATQVSVAAEVATAYLQLRGTQARLAHARSNLVLQEETLQIAGWRQQAGLVGALDVEQARNAAEQTRALLPQLQASEAQTRHAIAVLTGQPPSALDGSLSAPAALPRPPRGLAVAIPAQALRQRADVMAAELQMMAAAARVAQADAERYPALQLRASLAWSALTLGTLGSGAAATALVASLGQPLFDGGLRHAQLAAQQAAFDVASQAYRARVLLALREVQDALVALDGAALRMQALQRADEAAANAALLASQRYAGGTVDFQAVLETQRSRLSVQDSLAAAQADWAVGHVRLYKALGGGWPAPASMIGETR